MADVLLFFVCEDVYTVNIIEIEEQSECHESFVRYITYQAVC